MEVEASDMSVCTRNREEKVRRLAVRDIDSVNFYHGEDGEKTELAVLDMITALDYDQFLDDFHHRERPMQIMNPRNTPFNFAPIEWMPVISIDQPLSLRPQFDGQMLLLQVNSSLSYDDYEEIVFIAVSKGFVVLNIGPRPNERGGSSVIRDNYIFDKQINHIHNQIYSEEKLAQQARDSIEQMLNQLSLTMFSDIGRNLVDVEELESNEDAVFKSKKDQLRMLEKELKQYNEALSQLSDKSFCKEKMFTIKAKLRNLREARMKIQAVVEQEERIAPAKESDMHCTSQLLDEPGEIVTIVKHYYRWPKDVKRYTVWGLEHMDSLPCKCGDKVELAIIDELPSSEYKKIFEKAMEAGFDIIRPREAPFYYPRVRWHEIHSLEEMFSLHRDFEGQVILIFVDHTVPWNCFEEISYYAILKKYVIINNGPYKWSPENKGSDMETIILEAKHHLAEKVRLRSKLEWLTGALQERLSTKQEGIPRYIISFLNGEITSAKENLIRLKDLLQEKRKLYEAYIDHCVKELANLLPELAKMDDWLDKVRSVLMPPKARVVNINFSARLTKHGRSESQDTAYTATDLYHPNQDIPGSPMKKMKMEMEMEID